MTPSITETAAGRREWIGLAVLALPALLASLELTVTHLATPAIGTDLGASSTELLWIVDVYAFLLAGSLITIGALGDRIGRRRLLLIGAAGYGVASALAAYAPNPELLIAARALMGLTGATLTPSMFALVAVMFTVARQRTMAISAIVSSVAGGTAIGPLVGGWLLDRFWWGSAFLIGVPVMALLLIAGPLLLPEHRAGRGVRLDLLSALLSMAAVLPLVYGLKRIAAGGPDPYAVTALAAGAAFAVWFVGRQRRLSEPLVDLALFRRPAFGVSVAALAAGIFALWGANYAVAQYLQLVHGLDPLAAGLWTAPSAIGVIAGSTLAPRLAGRYRPGPVIAAGLVIAAAGFAILSRVGSLPVLVIGTVVVSAGLGPLMALAMDQVIRSAPVERAGMAAAISSTAPQLGGAFGIAVLGSLITLVYRDRLAGVPLPGVPAARDNLTAAVVAADRIGPETLRLAREAFTAGLHLLALVSMVLTLALAAAVAGLLRERD